MIKENLIYRMSDDLHIDKADEESQENWKLRVVYSSVGRIALASLWDKGEETISVRHLKNRIEETIRIYQEVFSEVKKAWENNMEKLVDEIYEIYRNTGYLYHSSYQVFYPIKTSSVHRDLVFERGCSPAEDVYMSGLGLYRSSRNDDNIISKLSINEMFQISTLTLREEMDTIIQEVSWEEENIEKFINSEYLNISYSLGKRYWKSALIKSEAPSLLRLGKTGKSYYFYRFLENKFMVGKLPEWRTESGIYLGIANALLYINGKLPTIQFQDKGTFVNISLGYLLPPSELSFFKLYSWPYDFNSPSQWDFKRRMSRSIFICFREVLETRGYCFKEE